MDWTGDDVPLVIDLDGTLIRTDLLYESFFSLCSRDLRSAWRVVPSLRAGKAPLKAFLATASEIDYALLPFNREVIGLIEAARAAGRKVYLATAADRRHATAVADHLGLFDGVFASDGSVNLSSARKADALVNALGARGFDYVGNSHDDVEIWRQARRAIGVNLPKSLSASLEKGGIEIAHLPGEGGILRTWIKALRVRQYTKNLLVFVPLLTSHAYTASHIVNAVLAFLAFSACASSVYLLNDLLDLQSDRKHPSKSRRPFASGALPIAKGLIAVPLLLLVGAGLALAVSLPFLGVLACYYLATLAYSLFLKRKLLVDVVTLAGLYTIRVIAGAVALPVAPSEWLLAFSMFMFVALALVKRYVELAMRIDTDLPDPDNRNYKLMDLPIIGALAAASAWNAVSVFALYVSSSSIRELYAYPELLWFICPILLYWSGRMVLLAHRRLIDDDPIVFALRDRISLIAGGLTLGIVLLAS